MVGLDLFPKLPNAQIIRIFAARLADVADKLLDVLVLSPRIDKPLGPPDKLTERVAFSEMRRR